MIEIYTGVPGSGKTYRAVSYLYDIFLDSKSKSYGKFTRFYTNINEFAFSEFDSMVAYDLNWDLLFEKLSQLHRLYMSKVDDSQLLELADSLFISNTFFVIDEAHNFFEKKNSVLVWWLSYHRHLHQDIILITQNLALIESKYKSFSEFFYKAIPSSLRVFSNTLKYEQYIGSRMFKNQRSEKFTLKFNPDVFSLYHSGANTQAKKVVYKYIAFALVGIIIASFAMWLIVHFLFGGGSSKKNSVTRQQNNTVTLRNNNSVTDPGLISVSSDTLNFICDFENCSVYSVVISNSDMKNYINRYKLDVKSMQDLHNGFFLYRYKVPPNFIKDVLND